MWRISFWLFFSIGYIIINNSIKADFNPYRPNRLHFHISIHAPRAGSDKLLSIQHGIWKSYFNPRSPCGERRFPSHLFRHKHLISIHAPRAGSDSMRKPHIRPEQSFQSTLPVRGATNLYCQYQQTGRISIHAPRAGSDYFFAPAPRRRIHFNPRSPCGERPGSGLYPLFFINNFNPRSPCGERRLKCAEYTHFLPISIHAPRAGSDGKYW